MARKVGFGIECWFFPERGQWKFGRNPEWRSNPIFAFGPLRVRFKTITINR